MKSIKLSNLSLLNDSLGLTIGRLVFKEVECSGGKTNANFKGKVDREGLPEKQGVLELAQESQKYSKGACVRIAPGSFFIA